jgi:peptidoglycan/LPS O-acetylase OafA/YrhL
LWPPLAVAVGVTTALYLFARPHAPFVGDGWDQPISPALVSHCLLLSESDGGCGSFVPTLWSLVYEARISAIFPLLVLLILRWPIAVVAVGIILSLVPSAGAETAFFSLFFMMGILAAIHADRLEKAARASRPLLVGLAGIILINTHYDLLNGFGAVALIVAVRHYPRVTAAFSHPVLLWCGRVSYSLYLIHISIFLCAYYTLGGPLSLPWALLCTAIAGVVAETMYRFVELPSIRLGRLLTTPAMAPSVGTVSRSG